MKNKKLTVIIPTHNSEKYILECVQSVQKQTYSNLQIICIDSSSDSTVEILKGLQLKDTRVEIIQDANGSYGHKLNVGIQHADGDYIAIVESDDYILPEMYETMLEGVDEAVDYIKCSGTRHFAKIHGKYVFYPQCNPKVEAICNQVIDLEQNRNLAFLNLPNIWTAIYRKDFLVQNNIWANETPGASFQDTSFTQAVAFLSKKCIYKKGAFYCYRNDNPNSSVKSKEKIFFVCDEYRHLEKILRLNHAYTNAVQKQILKLKTGTYAWNIQRLDEESIRVFRNGIIDEIKDYTPEIIDELSTEEKYAFDLVTNEEFLKQHNSRFEKISEKWQRVLSAMENGLCVLVGIGLIGKNVLWIQELLQEHRIIAVADNNYENLKCIGAYEIEAVEDVVEKYPKLSYIIANKYHKMNIKQQLEVLGIQDSQIIFWDETMGKGYLFQEVVKYYT